MNPASPAAFRKRDEASTFSKITWRLLPFLFLCYLCAYLDRINVAFAKLQMLKDLNFSDDKASCTRMPCRMSGSLPRQAPLHFPTR